MLIRTATSQDAKNISALVTSISQEHIADSLSEVGLKHLVEGMTVERMYERLCGGYIFFAAQEDAMMVGIAAIRLPSHLYYLFVRTEYQRTGIGQSLWRHSRNWVLENFPIKQITVNSSLNAVAAYERMGFVIAGPAEEMHAVRFQPMLWEDRS